MTDEPVPVAAPRVVSPYNPANILTVARIVLVPVFLALVVASGMTSAGWRLAACLAFCVASATDFADGWIARRFHLVTSFGKVADPIADKALTGTALVLLSAYDRVPWWVTAVILLREWGVTGLRFWVIRYGIIPASRGGKLKTALQIAAIAWFLWPVPEPFDAVGGWLMVAALVITVVTGVDYVVQAVTQRSTGPARADDGQEHAVDMGVAAAAAVHALVERRQTLATAESLTGGLMAATVVEIPGVSAVFRGGLVVYATQLKHELADVPADLLRERGPVDGDVARAMAEGVRRRCGSDWGLATTGVAGPEPQDGKPVGLVYVAVAGPDGADVQELHLTGNRAHVRTASVTAALNLLTGRLRPAPAPA